MEILFHDDGIVAVNKPAGLLVHRSDIDRRETSSALRLLRDHLGQRVYPVHRLDRPTSGVLLFALSPEVARRACLLFADHSVRKGYLAVVRGGMPEEGVIDHPLAEEPDRISDRQARGGKAPQTAVTEFRRLAMAELPVPSGRHATSRYSLVSLSPRTGRKHQLRRHCKHLNHPIVGDTTWGDGRHNRLFREMFDCDRLLLHAVELMLPHPVTGVPLRIVAPLDATMRGVVTRLYGEGCVAPEWRSS